MKSFVASSALVAAAMAVSIRTPTATVTAAGTPVAPVAPTVPTDIAPVAATVPADIAPVAATAGTNSAPIAPVVAAGADDATAAPIAPAAKKADEAPVATVVAPTNKPVAPVPAPVAATKHTAIPCLSIPSTNEAWTIFTKIDGDHSMTVTGEELEAAGKALSELNTGEDGANFDPVATKAIRDAVANFAKKHNGEIPLGAAIQGLQDGIRELNERSGACKAPEGVNAAAAAIEHFKMFAPVPCLSVPSHTQAQTIFHHIDQIESKDGRVTAPEMLKAIEAVGQQLASMGMRFDPALVSVVKDTIMDFVAKHKGAVSEEEGIKGLQQGVLRLNEHTGSCKAVGGLPGVRSADVAQAAISHWRMATPAATMTKMATAPDGTN